MISGATTKTGTSILVLIHKINAIKLTIKGEFSLKRLSFACMYQKIQILSYFSYFVMKSVSNICMGEC